MHDLLQLWSVLLVSGSMETKWFLQSDQGFFVQSLWCSHTWAINPQEELAKLKNPAIFWWPFGTHSLHMAISGKNSSVTWGHFSLKKICYMSCTGFSFSCQVVKIAKRWHSESDLLRPPTPSYFSHFPMQKRLKMLDRTSSETSSPLIWPSARAASFKSIVHMSMGSCCCTESFILCSASFALISCSACLCWINTVEKYRFESLTAEPINPKSTTPNAQILHLFHARASFVLSRVKKRWKLCLAAKKARERVQPFLRHFTVGPVSNQTCIVQTLSSFSTIFTATIIQYENGIQILHTWLTAHWWPWLLTWPKPTRSKIAISNSCIPTCWMAHAATFLKNTRSTTSGKTTELAAALSTLFTTSIDGTSTTFLASWSKHRNHYES